MKTITVSQAKANWSSLLRKVARGESVLIVSRGRPIARLVPAERAAAGTDEDRLARLERKGIIRRASRPPNLDFLKMPAPRVDEEHSLLRALLEERGEGR